MKSASSNSVMPSQPAQPIHVPLDQHLQDRLLYLLARTHITFTDAVSQAIQDYCDREELRLRMEADYEAGSFSALSA